MRYRRLGRSGLFVSELVLGAMTFVGSAPRAPWGTIGNTDLAGARRQIDLAIDAGVNMIDTADMYGAGASEEIVGEALKDRRDDLLIATKARFAMGLGPNDVETKARYGRGVGPNDEGLSRRHLIRACEASLRRLQVDHIDLYQVHEWDGLTPIEETVAALDHLVQSGKVRYVGCSNFAGWQMMKALGAARQRSATEFVSHQVYLSLQERSAEYELVPSAIDQDIGLLVWSPLAGGLLSGKYRRGETPPAGTRHAVRLDEPPIHDEGQLHDTVDVLVEIGAEHGTSAARVALAWLVDRPGITAAIVGARTDDQLADNLAAAQLRLTDEDRVRLERVSRPRLIYPFWHQRATAAARLSPADLSLIGPHLSA
jgi:aryl-alcohol dehydrogenase-like predicted oxidoreductase